MNGVKNDFFRYSNPWLPEPESYGKLVGLFLGLILARAVFSLVQFSGATYKKSLKDFLIEWLLSHAPGNVENEYSSFDELFVF